LPLVSLPRRQEINFTWKIDFFLVQCLPTRADVSITLRIYRISNSIGKRNKSDFSVRSHRQGRLGDGGERNEGAIQKAQLHGTSTCFLSSYECYRENDDYTKKVINFKKKKARAFYLDAHVAALRNVSSPIIIIHWTATRRISKTIKYLTSVFIPTGHSRINRELQIAIATYAAAKCNSDNDMSSSIIM